MFRHLSEAFTLLRIIILIIASKGYPVNPGDSKNPEGPLCEILALKGEKERNELSYWVTVCDVAFLLLGENVTASGQEPTATQDPWHITW